MQCYVFDLVKKGGIALRCKNGFDAKIYLVQKWPVQKCIFATQRFAPHHIL
jgi:hypothetical protein